MSWAASAPTKKCKRPMSASSPSARSERAGVKKLLTSFDFGLAEPRKDLWEDATIIGLRFLRYLGVVPQNELKHSRGGRLRWALKHTLVNNDFCLLNASSAEHCGSTIVMRASSAGPIDSYCCMIVKEKVPNSIDKGNGQKKEHHAFIIETVNAIAAVSRTFRSKSSRSILDLLQPLTFNSPFSTLAAMLSAVYTMLTTGTVSIQPIRARRYLHSFGRTGK